MRDFLVEIHSEELPPKALQRLQSSFLQEIETRLRKADLTFSTSFCFATPRRLAVMIKKLASKQPDLVQERKGPALAQAFDQKGQPTQACIGFARSCGVTPAELKTIKNEQGEWVGFSQPVVGQSAEKLLPDIVREAIAALPIPKRMRWGDSNVEFARPVHSVILLYGKEIIHTHILGCETDRKTRGHRFMSKGWMTVSQPSQYAKRLENKYVIADFTARKEKIRNETNTLIQKTFGESVHAMMPDALLDEVTGLVEWPFALCGSFDRDFLSVPPEVIISAMQDHQRYFPVVDQAQKLLPHFVTISNIESRDPKEVIEGNERVLRARLSDAKFFYEADLKEDFTNRLSLLKNMIFQDKLGTLFDKAERLSRLMEMLAKSLHLDVETAKQSGLLAKVDLTTHLVGEFPELQGIAGFYYTINDPRRDMSPAIRDQYRPRFAGDTLPETPLGAALAIADRIDTLVGVFGINQGPTSEKDPFGLRRAALGVLRILIEKKLDLDLRTLLQDAARGFAHPLPNQNVEKDVLHFMLERLKPWYQEQHISSDVLQSVFALNISHPYDLHRRVQAVQQFKALPEAVALSAANKRVSNILSKYEEAFASDTIDENLFEDDAEKILASELNTHRELTIALSQKGQYQEILSHLSGLRTPVDTFFDKVLVMTDDKKRRENRLLLLKQLRELFLHVADIAHLQ